MNLNVDFNNTGFSDNKLICGGFAKTIEKEKHRGFCLCCMEEDTEESKKWDRYELKCGHQYHTRCLRKLWDCNRRVFCSYCGDINENNSLNSYCSKCKEWGHSNYKHLLEVEEEFKKSCYFCDY
jgi:hypothetical protein